MGLDVVICVIQQMTQNITVTMQDRGLMSMDHPAADLMVTLSMTSRDPK